MTHYLEQISSDVRTWPEDAVARQNLQYLLPKFAEDNREYWTGIHRLAEVFADCGVQFITIKSIRSYPYVDSNIDIIVSQKDWRKLSAAVTRQTWRKPNWKEFLEQTLVEPFKLKYKAIDNVLPAAHFYGGVRWRYATPFMLDRVDPALLWRELPEQYGNPENPDAKSQILVPTDEFDMVIQVAHVTIENYRLTIGEMVHISETLKKPGFDHARMDVIAKALGLSYCLKAICDLAMSEFSHGRSPALDRKPMRIPFGVIAKSHLQYGVATGAAGLLRATASLAWYPVMRVGRKILGR
ncbi:hypothetical protein N6L26_05900 [Qipengyuania sp. SS22]|uniref:hypothetical protein n=1 Tax=Qipengyuania sp. SS22 TaxID=2979461 RepID=UPI0021E5820A|nr:hypothetical protein [Qipengyuania sp. SS22]UYH56083.1 hypothetical protein N6L26_05900 [Qipengyuania sp. SS22]